jgi:hypothetical protein
MARWKVHLILPLSIGLLPILLLLAVHYRPLWSSETARTRKALQAHPFTRIFKVPATFYRTGLEIRDIITYMAVDSDGNIWLASSTGGPYVCTRETNECDNLLEPDTIYGLFADHSAVWVLTSSGAHLWQSAGRIRSLGFPRDGIPVAGALRPDGSLLFSTNTALFLVPADSRSIAPLPFSHRLTEILPAPDDSTLLLAPGRVWRMNGRAIEQIPGCTARNQFAAALQLRNDLLLATTDDGLIRTAGSTCQHFSFARRSLNAFEPGSAITHRGIPCFGSAEGSLVFYRHNRWERMKISRMPITALATDGTTLYAWTDGQLLAVSLRS